MVTSRSTTESRVETIRRGNAATVSLGRGVRLCEFASKTCGAQGFSTASAIFDPSAALPYHTHSVSEAVTVLKGAAAVAIEGRRYLLEPFDCIHVPAKTAHEVTNSSSTETLVALSAFASEEVDRAFVERKYPIEERGFSNPHANDPESIVRFREAEIYQLSDGAEFRDLFAGRFGAVGICGGYGRFQPGASLPCHIHRYDESITIIEGEAVCLVQGNRYTLSGCDTAFVPEGRPHRFLNHSRAPMAMIWVYAGSEPERTLLSPEYCDGTLAWPGASNVT